MGAGARTAAVADRASLAELLAQAPPRRHRPTMQPDRTWYRIQNNAEQGSAEIWLYDEIGYWGTTAQDFVDELKNITASRITMHVNSPGGEVFDGVAIYNCLKAHPAEVHVSIEGLAASAASFIAQAGDRITIARNAMMMIHDASGLAWGDARTMRELADLLDKLSDNIADIYAQRAGGTTAEWRERMLAETWYTGAEAVAAGLADEQTDPDPEPSEEMSNRWDLSIFTSAPVAGGPSGGEDPPPPATTPEPQPETWTDFMREMGQTIDALVLGPEQPADSFDELAAGLLAPPSSVDDLLASLREAPQ